MNGWQFMASSPILTFFLAAIAATVIVRPIRLFFRHLNIRKQGWPPAHCDADGDQVEQDDE